MGGKARDHGKAIGDVVTLRQPLGSPYTEALISPKQDVFLDSTEYAFSQLYDATNHVHRQTSQSTAFIIGRKGSGKTAFLIGGALAEKADVVLVKSEDIYMVVNELRLSYEKGRGAIPADSLAHVWEVLLFHAAMCLIARSNSFPESEEWLAVWGYMSGFGEPNRAQS